MSNFPTGDLLSFDDLLFEQAFERIEIMSLMDSPITHDDITAAEEVAA